MAKGKSPEFSALDAESLLRREEASTGACAQLSAWATRRYELESEGRKQDPRTAFMHDRDRVIHSRAFRRLKHKTQVFIPYTNDHQRTRLTHTVEVMQISRTIARCLGLNEDLTETIALGHDLGHTPFGHVGEKTLDAVMRGKDVPEGIPPELASAGGGFKHNLQSLKVIDEIESRYGHPGLNLSDQAREGILKHTRWKKWVDYPGLEKQGLHLERSEPHFEGQVVASADEIAQQTHDLEDGLRGRIVPFGDVMELDLVKRIAAKNELLRDKKVGSYVKQNTIIRSLIHVLIVDVIQESERRLRAWCKRHKMNSHADFAKKQDAISRCVDFSSEMHPLFKELEKFVVGRVIRSRQVQLNDESGRYLIRELFSIYYNDPRLLPFYALERYRADNKIEHLQHMSKRSTEEQLKGEIAANYHGRPEFLRLVCDYIAGMSNTYAIREYEKLIMPFHG
ncbi:MAG TPA: dNTP triphosphohydrolase [Acidobacteriota bacterium]|nr:dNTP triphosphohydrolase [Acidobacteriota bacterium]